MSEVQQFGDLAPRPERAQGRLIRIRGTGEKSGDPGWSTRSGRLILTRNGTRRSARRTGGADAAGAHARV